VQAITAGPGTAYVINAADPAVAFATHDDGRSWRQLSAPCPGAGWGQLAAAGPDAVWVSCVGPSGTSLVRRSVDRGRHWQTLPGISAPLQTLAAGSATVAWALTEQGHVVRTADGGRDWSTVWTVGASQPAALAGHTPLLAAQSGLTAEVVVSLTRALGAGRHDAADVANDGWLARGAYRVNGRVGAVDDPDPGPGVDAPPLPLRIDPEIQATMRRRGDVAHPSSLSHRPVPGSATWNGPEHADRGKSAIAALIFHPLQAGPADCGK
jgi:hypothetical protein